MTSSSSSSGSTSSSDDLDASSSQVVSFDPLPLLGYAFLMFVFAFVFFILPYLPFFNTRLTAYQLSGLSVSTWTLLYFGFSVTLVVYNKWLLAVWEGGFPFPVFVTLIHMSVKLVLSKSIVRMFYSKQDVPSTSWKTWFVLAAPVGVTTSLDVAASNASLFYVSVPVYTVVKSTTLVFVLIFSVLYRLQQCTIKLVLSVVVICVGVVLSSLGNRPEDLQPIGFFLVFLASAIGGYRWALTELLMLDLGSKMSSLMTIYIISPAAVLSLIPLMLWLEGTNMSQSKFYLDPGLFTLAVLNVLGSGIFAFAMIFVELGLLHRTSSLSLAVIGYLKQIFQVVLSVIVFRDVLSPVNVFGMLLTLAGMFAYLRAKADAKLPVTAPPRALQMRTISHVIANVGGVVSLKGGGGGDNGGIGGGAAGGESGVGLLPGGNMLKTGAITTTTTDGLEKGLRGESPLEDDLDFVAINATAHALAVGDDDDDNFDFDDFEADFETAKEHQDHRI